MFADVILIVYLNEIYSLEPDESCNFVFIKYQKFKMCDGDFCLKTG